MEKENIETLIERCNEYISKNPDDCSGYCTRGNLFLCGNRIDDAIKDFTKAIEINPRFSEAYNRRGLAKMGLNKLEEALDDFDKAIGIDSYNECAFYNRAVLFLKKKEYGPAMDDVSEAYTIADDEDGEFLDGCDKLYFGILAGILKKDGLLKEGAELVHVVHIDPHEDLDMEDDDEGDEFPQEGSEGLPQEWKDRDESSQDGGINQPG